MSSPPTTCQLTYTSTTKIKMRRLFSSVRGGGGGGAYRLPKIDTPASSNCSCKSEVNMLDIKTFDECDVTVINEGQLSPPATPIISSSANFSCGTKTAPASAATTAPTAAAAAAAAPATNRPTTRPRAPAPLAIIESIATGAPAASRSQSDVAAQICDLFGPSSPHCARIPRIYANTRIATRHKAVDPLDPAFDRAMPIRARMDLFLTHAAPLAIDVARRALDAAAVADPAAEIGLLVLVTSTGFVAPGVDVAVTKALGLSPGTKRTIINFMGCAAAMNGLRTAVDYAVANTADSPSRLGETGKKALLVCVELSSVNGVFKETLNDVIISSLFGDGCAAVVVGGYAPPPPPPAPASGLVAEGHDDEEGAEEEEKQDETQQTIEAALRRGDIKPGQIVVRGSFSHLTDETEDGILLGVNGDGITCDLSAKLPSYIRAGVGPAIGHVLDRHGLAKADVDLWAIHPGGPKIIDESIRSLGLPEEAARVSWDVLSRCGNMLSVSLLFVLQQMVREVVEGAPGNKAVSSGIAFSFGPGITVEGLVFDVLGRV